MDAKERLSEFIFQRGLTQRNLVVDHDGGVALSFSMEIPPREFLSLAEDAFERGEVGFVDAISNAQRAVRAQIKYVLGALGFETKKLKIGAQMKLLSELGIIAPRILRKVSEPRNLLEHQYKRPSQIETEDAIDLAGLFIEATNHVVGMFESGFLVQKATRRKYENVILVRFTKGKTYSLRLLEGPASVIEIEMDANASLFIPIHRVAVALSRETGSEHDPRVSSAFFDLLDAMGIPKSRVRSAEAKS